MHSDTVSAFLFFTEGCRHNMQRNPKKILSKIKRPCTKKHSYRKQTHTDSTQLAGRDTGNEPHLHLAISSDLVDLRTIKR